MVSTSRKFCRFHLIECLCALPLTLDELALESSRVIRARGGRIFLHFSSVGSEDHQISVGEKKNVRILNCRVFENYNMVEVKNASDVFASEISGSFIFIPPEILKLIHGEFKASFHQKISQKYETEIGEERIQLEVTNKL